MNIVVALRHYHVFSLNALQVAVKTAPVVLWSLVLFPGRVTGDPAQEQAAHSATSGEGGGILIDRLTRRLWKTRETRLMQVGR